MQRFNIRVYGILINVQKQVLLSDEFIRGNYYTKFPGGGLEFGEGTRDCLKREFKEEMDLETLLKTYFASNEKLQKRAEILTKKTLTLDELEEIYKVNNQGTDT